MGFEIKKGSGTVVLCPTGSHVARCYMAIDEGTHPEEYQGEFKGNVQKVRLGFELPLKLHTFREEKGQEPFTLSMQLTYSMHEKAKLRKMLESWRGKPYTEESLAKFKKAGIPVLVGQPCLLNVIHKPKRDGGQRADIAAVTPLPEGLTCPPAIMKPIIFTVDDPKRRDSDIFKSLPNWLQEEISKCHEWCPPANTQTSEPNHADNKAETEGGGGEEDEPF